MGFVPTLEPTLWRPTAPTSEPTTMRPTYGTQYAEVRVLTPSPSSKCITYPGFPDDCERIRPTARPTKRPTPLPTSSPTAKPTDSPHTIGEPSRAPSKQTNEPTQYPSTDPTTNSPTYSPEIGVNSANTNNDDSQSSHEPALWVEGTGLLITTGLFLSTLYFFGFCCKKDQNKLRKGKKDKTTALIKWPVVLALFFNL